MISRQGCKGKKLVCCHKLLLPAAALQLEPRSTEYRQAQAHTCPCYLHHQGKRPTRGTYFCPTQRKTQKIQLLHELNRPQHTSAETGCSILDEWGRQPVRIPRPWQGSRTVEAQATPATPPASRTVRGMTSESICRRRMSHTTEDMASADL